MSSFKHSTLQSQIQLPFYGTVYMGQLFPKNNACLTRYLKKNLNFRFSLNIFISGNIGITEKWQETNEEGVPFFLFLQGADLSY